jgi:hypothetical protein
MITRLLCLLMALAAVTPPAQASAVTAKCGEIGWTLALKSSLADLVRTDFEASQSDWVQGGSWSTYMKKDGKPHTLIRTDLGERGRRELRLTILRDGDYAITVTTILNSGNIFTDDVYEPIDTQTRNFCYKAGKLDMPDFLTGGEAEMAPDPYVIAGEDAKRTMLLDRDVAAFTAGLAR